MAPHFYLFYRWLFCMWLKLKNIFLHFFFSFNKLDLLIILWVIDSPPRKGVGDCLITTPWNRKARRWRHRMNLIISIFFFFYLLLLISYTAVGILCISQGGRRVKASLGRWVIAAIISSHFSRQIDRAKVCRPKEFWERNRKKYTLDLWFWWLEKNWAIEKSSFFVTIK